VEIIGALLKRVVMAIDLRYSATDADHVYRRRRSMAMTTRFEQGAEISTCASAVRGDIITNPMAIVLVQ